MSEITTRRLRALFNSLREKNTDDKAYEDMQRILPPDPTTGNAYSSDQIWAWLNGADNSELEARSNYWGGDFVQVVSFEDAGGQTRYFSFRMELERGHDVLNLLTSREGANRRLETARNIMKRYYQYQGNVRLDSVTPFIPTNSYKYRELVELPSNYEELDEDDYEEFDPYFYDEDE